MDIQFKTLEDHILIGETIGLQKSVNEDSSGFKIGENALIVCLCDGHWGGAAAEMVKKQILGQSFPKSKKQAIQFVKKIEHTLWKKFGKDVMDSEKDFTPEASFVAIEKVGNRVSIMSYGDCRLVVARNGKLIFRLKTTPNWLGAFSYLKLRKRIAIERALIFKKIICQPEDIIMLFSDGVDECKYEVKTIDISWLVSQTKNNSSLRRIADNIFKAVEKNGAEDNASLAVVKI